MIKKILKQAIKENDLVGIRTLSLEFDESIIGYVSEINEDSFELIEVDENAILVGKTIINFEDVYCVTYQDRYQKRLKFTLDNIEKIRLGEQILFYGNGVKLENKLQDLLKQRKVATFYFEDEHFATGFLYELNNEYLLINNIGIEGDEDGISCYSKNDLCGLRYNGFNEQNIELLFNSFGNVGNSTD